jgi:hypothetical protein
MDPATTQAVAKATEETAKATGKGLEIVHDTGGFFAACSPRYLPTSLGLSAEHGCTRGTFAFAISCADARNRFCAKGTCKT